MAYTAVKPLKLWLDDERTPPDRGWVWVDNAAHAILILKSFRVTELSLDHDLGDELVFGNGNDVLVWVEEQVHTNMDYIPPLMYIHTQNAAAMQKMILGVKAIQKTYLHRRRE